MTDRRQRWRMMGLTLLMAAAWIVVTFRLCVLHLGENAQLRAEIEQIHTVQERLVAERGRIYDVRGNILAMDLPVKDIAIDPTAIRNSTGMAPRVVAALSSVLEMDPAAIWPRIAWTNKYSVIRRNVPVEAADKLKSITNISGILYGDVSRRYYPRGTLASPIIGYSGATKENPKIVGQSGIERRAERYLQGNDGLRLSERDGRRREILTQRVFEIEPRAGSDVYLTIDQNIQFFAEQAVARAIEKNNAIAGWAVLQRVKTGEILAMVSFPSYDPNDLAKANPTNRLNRTIGYTYEPGSTFKVATIAAALDAGTVGPRTLINCENGVWMYGGRPLRDFHPAGTESVGDVLKVSSNIGSAKIALTLGAPRLHQYLREFGFGERTGITLPGEDAGILNRLSNWSGISITRVPMGHEVAVTSIQLLGVLNAISNDGLLVKPQILDRVVTHTGNTLYQRKLEVLSRPLKPQTALLMRKLLTRVTEKSPKHSGTGTRARVDGYTVAGKTGTAEKIIDGQYSKTKNIASFVGICPAERPELALIVVIDEPSIPNQRTGGYAAAPAFKEIMEFTLRYLNIPPVPPDQMWTFGDEVPSA